MLMLDLFQKGGPVMYALLFCSILGLYIFIQKFIYITYHRIHQDTYIDEVKEKITSLGITKTASELRTDRKMISRVLAYALKLSNLPREEVEEGLKAASLLEIPKLEKNMSILSVLITVCPMLGLLGTVLGLLDIFHVISGGAISNTEALAGGIAEALITTIAGLSIAIPFIFAHQYLAQKIDRYIMDMERIVHEILNFCKINPGIVTK